MEQTYIWVYLEIAGFVAKFWVSSLCDRFVRDLLNDIFDGSRERATPPELNEIYYLERKPHAREIRILSHEFP